MDAGDGRMLLILDLDEMLIHASEAPLAHPADFRISGYHAYRRPRLGAYLDTLRDAPDVRRLEKRGWMWRTAATGPQSSGSR